MNKTSLYFTLLCFSASTLAQLAPTAPSHVLTAAAREGIVHPEKHQRILTAEEKERLAEALIVPKGPQALNASQQAAAEEFLAVGNRPRGLTAEQQEAARRFLNPPSKPAKHPSTPPARQTKP